MANTKVYSSKEFTDVVLKNGFEYVGCNGDHKKYKRGSSTIVINKNINKMVARRIIKENNLVL